MIAESTVRQLAALYLRAEIRTWESLEQRIAEQQDTPRSRMNLWSARRSKRCFQRMLDDLEAGDIADDLERRRVE